MTALVPIPLIAGRWHPGPRSPTLNPVPSDLCALRSALRAVIDRHDPEGLLALGAPRDEYDPEAADLAHLRSSGGPFTSVAVAEVWERWFGPHSGFVARASQAELEAFAGELEAAAADVGPR